MTDIDENGLDSPQQSADSSFDMAETSEAKTVTKIPGKVEGLSELRSSKSTRRLEQIADLRARGIGDHIALPQLVVCGDQSAGKSSVLEGITGIPFPRNDGVCTKFPTEIILQHSNNELSIIATILPNSLRSDKSKDLMRSYRRELKAFVELPKAIADAGQLMGIRGFGDIQVGPAFAEDVLRIDVSGPFGLHLSVVDLPGLFTVPNDEQTDDDVSIVQRIADSYIKNPRTIILAVVQAGNDIANQGIIQKSRLHDKSGKRTVGIITKPDLINQGAESRIALLARNQDTTKLKLGYFLIKNPTPKELDRGITQEQRQQSELKYFQSPPWKEQNLDAERVGILSLRSYLQTLLDEHIEQELPKVRKEVSKLLEETNQQMLSLGEERPTAGHRRLYLSRLAMQFHGLTLSALNGTYHEADAEFFDADQLQESTRLRALLHTWNTDFSDTMWAQGEKRRVVDEPPSENEGSDDGSDAVTKAIANPQLLITFSEMQDWVREIYLRTRGKELPGNYNHILLSEMFRIQSSRWGQIAEDHLDTVATNIDLFIQEALSYLIKDDQVRTDVVEIANDTLQKQNRNAEEELQKLLEDEKLHPITQNHYYTDNVQKSRLESMRMMIEDAMAETKRNNPNGLFDGHNTLVNGDKLLASLKNQLIVDMSEQACAEALNGLHAYYKVARKIFVDNVCRQVIERHLVKHLPSIFSPETVAAMDDDGLERIAAEKPGTLRKRKELTELQSQLSESLRSLRR